MSACSRDQIVLFAPVRTQNLVQPAKLPSAVLVRSRSSTRSIALRSSPATSRPSGSGSGRRKDKSGEPPAKKPKQSPQEPPAEPDFEDPLPRLRDDDGAWAEPDGVVPPPQDAGSSSAGAIVYRPRGDAEAVSSSAVSSTDSMVTQQVPVPQAPGANVSDPVVTQEQVPVPQVDT